MVAAEIRLIPKQIVSVDEFKAAWDWLIDHISIIQILVEEQGFYYDHKHWQFPDHIICVDECENADEHLARLYLVSQLASVSDYLKDLKAHNFLFNLDFFGQQLDEDVARVIKAQETDNHLNSFRNSLSEHLAYWVNLASIIKINEHQDFSISKPNLQPEDKGSDGLACVLYDDHLRVKLVSVKNSINSPKELISSAHFRKKSMSDLDEKKLLDEFYAFQNRDRGFQRLDEKINTLLNELHIDATNIVRRVYLHGHSQFNALVIADEQYADRSLFMGFNIITDQPDRCIGIYIGSRNWQIFADVVQRKVQEILEIKGISF